MRHPTALRRSAVLASAALTAALAGAALAPVPAGASTPAPRVAMATAPGPVTVTGTARPLTRGGATDSFTYTLTNHSAHAVAWQGDMDVISAPVDGPSPIWWQQAAVTVTPLHAPATAAQFRLDSNGSGPGFVVGLHPAGHPSNALFTIAAGKSLSWTVRIGLSKSFPANDGSLDILFDNWSPTASNRGAGPFTGVDIHIPTSPNIRPGHLAEALASAPGSTVRTGTPLDLSLTLHNTGSAPFSSGLRTQIRAETYQTGLPIRSPLALDVREEGRWVQLPDQSGAWTLPAVPSDFAGGATYTYRLRLRLPVFHGVSAYKDVLVAQTGLDTGDMYPINMAEGIVTVAH